MTKIYIKAPEIFGGEDREGGVEGCADWLNGEPTQTTNEYLIQNVGTPIPAFRGVSSLVLNQAYVSAFNPYLKNWEFWVTRIMTRQNGLAQWYPEKAKIGGAADGGTSYPYLDSNGIEVYMSPPDQTAAVITGPTSVQTVGGWQIGTLVNGAAFSASQDTEVEFLLVGAGGSVQGAGGGGGSGQVLICKYLMTGGVTYRATVGVASLPGGDSFIRVDGFDQTHESAVVALGGHGGSFTSLRNTCQPGYGGSNKWGGSGAASPGYFSTEDGPAGAPPCSLIPGGVGACKSGGSSPATLIITAEGELPMQYAHGGRAGGAGAGSNGEDGGEASGSMASGVWKAGDGGKGGIGVWAQFDGTNRIYAFGGAGQGGYTRAFGSGSGSFGTNAPSWRATYGNRPGSGGDGPDGSGSSGEIKIRWRVAT